MGQNFRNIIAWQKSDDLVVAVYEMTKKYFPKEELFALTRQMRTAAVSIPANIAEGAGKRTLVDFRRFLDQALGSLNEVEYYIHLSQRLGYIDEHVATPLRAQQSEAAKTLNGLIGAIDQQIAAGQRTYRPK